MRERKKPSAEEIILILCENQRHAWCRKMLSGLRLPRTVHCGSYYRVWPLRFYPYGVYSEKKRLEKLDYRHNNTVKTGLVRSPEQWPWSSYRYYYLNDLSLLSMDALV
jgi:putative transposase